jgi:hypothetical protein
MCRIGWPGGSGLVLGMTGRDADRQITLGSNYPPDFPDPKLWKLTPAPSDHCYDDFDSGSETDGSYTIVKTTVRTKKVQSKKRRG